LSLAQGFTPASIRADPDCLAYQRVCDAALDEHQMRWSGRVPAAAAPPTASRAELVAQRLQGIETPSIPVPIEDSQNPNMTAIAVVRRVSLSYYAQVQAKPAVIKIGQKNQNFKHVKVDPTFVAARPTLGVMYDMLDLSPDWYRHDVRLAACSSSKTPKKAKWFPHWNCTAEVLVRKCGGSAMCTHDGCTYSTSRRGGARTKGVKASANDKMCPIHKCVLKASGPCPVHIYTWEECAPTGCTYDAEGAQGEGEDALVVIDASERRFAIATFGDGHNHECWSTIGLQSKNRELLSRTAENDPTIKVTMSTTRYHRLMQLTTWCAASPTAIWLRYWAGCRFI
jgi:hypothetical protein